VQTESNGCLPAVATWPPAAAAEQKPITTDDLMTMLISVARPGGGGGRLAIGRDMASSSASSSVAASRIDLEAVQVITARRSRHASVLRATEVTYRHVARIVSLGG